MRRIIRIAAVSLAVGVTTATVPSASGRALFWGETGHRITGRLAAEALPADMPAFFRMATAQLEYLNPEPDRWRSRDEMLADPALNNATQFDHYVDMEQVPPGALRASSRFAYLDSVKAAGFATPAVGTLPFRIVELTQRLRVEFRLWRAETNTDNKRFIEQRIVNDAGILGHYVADGSNPHHTTIHHDGWVGDNPRGYTAGHGFHSRFETVYVQAQITGGDVRPFVKAPAQTVNDVRGGTVAYLTRTHDQLTRLYDLDKAEPFSPTNTNAEHKRFTEERLAAGVEMLRDLWWTAWVTSGMEVKKDR